MTPKEAEAFLNQYFETYPGIRSYIADTIAAAGAAGHVSTLMGRKRFFPELTNRRLPYNQRAAVERAAINAPIQGTAADIMKLAMLQLAERLHRERLRARMLLQVHDELVVESPEDELDTVVDLVRDVMGSAYRLVVPLKVDVEVGRDWYDMDPA
jgi:DNA polymerase-1